MSDVLKWGGWEVRGRLVLKPRRVRLSPLEEKVLRAFLADRIAGRAARFFSTAELAGEAGTVEGSIRPTIRTLREALGSGTILSRRNRGYAIANVKDRNKRAPVDELIDNLKLTLAAANRLKLSIEEELY